MNKISLHKAGYTISVWGVAIILLWVGAFKFTPTEAKAIEGLVSNSFLMSWLYKIWSQQGVSNLIGIVEIITGIALLLHFYWKKAGILAGLLGILTFIITLSFLFTTPGVFRKVDGMLVTDFFILKDIMALGISLLVLDKSLENAHATAR
ncbi:DUF417 family protein [Niabella insulamsoli]|uniref:DUF417 family protein n=1 Tax=Niabella insulamsoli TaxID=3144874 RepID=UPI0031FDA14E